MAEEKRPEDEGTPPPTTDNPPQENHNAPVSPVAESTVDETVSTPEPTTPPVVEKVEIPFSFSYLKVDPNKPVERKPEPVKTPEPVKQPVKAKLPPGFELRKSNIGPIEGHPQEGFKAAPESEPEPLKIEAPVVAEPVAEPVVEPVTADVVEDDTADEPEETLFPEEATGADNDRNRNNRRRRNKRRGERDPQPAVSSEIEVTETVTDMPIEQASEVKPVIPNVGFRSDRSIAADETVAEPEAKPVEEKRVPRELREPRQPQQRREQATPPRREPPTQQPKRDVPTPTQPLQRPESSKYMGGGQRGPVSSNTSEGAIRGKLGGAPDQQIERRPQQQPPSRGERPDRDNRRDDTRQQSRRPDPRQSFRRDSDDENSLDALKRKVGELTATDRKVLNYLVAKKRITRNLNEHLEKQTLGYEKLVETLGSLPMVTIMVIVWIGAVFYFGFKGEEANSVSKSIAVFLMFAAIWGGVVLLALRARIVRERERASLDYEQQLKFELELRAVRDRIDNDIAPRMPELQQVIRKLQEKPKA